jgi:cytochrome c-type biogenesis protein CcmH
MTKLLSGKFTYLIFILTPILFSFLLPAGVSLAQDMTPSDDEVNQIASQLYCPVCENIPLDVCPLDVCEQWRDLIRQQIGEGWTEQDIKDYFVAQYGDRVLGEPPRRGLNWMLYLLPPIVILLGVTVLLSKLKRIPQAPLSRDAQRSDDPYMKQVERDLKNLDK